MVQGFRGGALLSSARTDVKAARAATVEKSFMIGLQPSRKKEEKCEPKKEDKIYI